MRLLLLFGFIVLAGCAGGKMLSDPVDPLALPTLAGTITTDQVLDGDYLLSADLQIPRGLTLTIKPGSRIYIQPSDSTKIDPEFLSRENEILVRGSLIAVGTSSKPIQFKPVTDDETEILWSGLQLVDSEQVRLSSVVIEQAENGLLCLNASPVVSSLIVERSRYGIVLQQQSTPVIKDSLVKGGEAGFFCWDQSAPQVSNSRFEGLQEEGIYLGRGCQGHFVDNVIAGTDRAVVLPVDTDFAASNRLIDNRLDLVRYDQEAK